MGIKTAEVKLDLLLATSSQKRLLHTLAFGTAGAVVNLFRVPLFFGADFLFGGTFALVPALLFGPLYGLLSSFVSAWPSILHWNHPYAIIIMALEGLVVGLWVSRRRNATLEAELGYWLLFGIPLVVVLYLKVLALPMHTAWLIAMKQTLNGLVNVAVCGLGLKLFGLERKLGLGAVRARPMRSLLADVLTIVAMTPVVIAASWFGTWLESRIEADATRHASLVGTAARHRLGQWASDHLRAVGTLAERTSPHMENPDRLQRWTALTHDLLLSFRTVYIADHRATTIAFYPETNHSGTSTLGLNFADRPYFEMAQQAEGPFITEAFQGRGGTNAVISNVIAPVRDAHGTFLGFVCGSVNLDFLESQVIPPDPARQILLVVDSAGSVVFSSSARWQQLAPWREQDLGSKEIRSEEIARLLPDQDSALARWQQGYFLWEQQDPVTHWRIITLIPITRYAARLFEGYTVIMTVALLFIVLVWAASQLLSRWMVLPLERLACTAHAYEAATHSGVWPSSDHIAEIRELSASLSQLVSKLQGSIRRLSVSEEHLRLYAERLQLAMVTSRTAIWERDPDTGLISWIGNTVDTVGMPASYLSALRDGFRLVHPKDRPRLAQVLRHLRKAHGSIDTEFRAFRPDGSIQWLLARSKSVEGDGGVSGRVIGTITEITRQKRNEALLEGQKRILEEIAAGASSSVVLEALLHFMQEHADQSSSVAWVLDSAENSLTLAGSCRISPEAAGMLDSILVEPSNCFGAVVTTRCPVISAGLASDPLWEPFAPTFLSQGLLAGWLMPIESRDGTVLGVLGMFPRMNRGPSDWERHLMELAASLAGLTLDRERLERERAQLATRRDEWVGQVVRAQEAERQRVARDLHDWLALGLVSPSYRIHAARQLLKRAPQEADIELDLVLQDLRSAGGELRKIMLNLRPYLLDELGVAEAIESYVSKFGPQSGLQCLLEVDPVPEVNDYPHVAIVLFRIVQEALTNVVKHAGASETVIRLSCEDHRVRLEIQDNGIGFSPADVPSAPGHYGIVGMSERLHLVGGRLEIASAPGAGTLVSVEIPLLEDRA